MRVLPLLAILCLSTPVFAQEASQAKQPKPEKKICRSIMSTGTILGGKRECHTKAEWDRLSQAAHDYHDQRDRNLGGRNGGLGVDRN